MSTEKRPVILDCDPGIDDAVAILLAARAPELDLRAVTAVAGNVDLEHTSRNARRVLTLAGVEAPEGVEARDFYFAIALLDQLYWIAGSVIGAVAGALITINTQGIDFAMTALFLVIAVEQWQSASRHLPVFLGAGGTLVCLLALGAENGQFLIPALGILVAGLLLLRPYLDREEEKV